MGASSRLGPPPSSWMGALVRPSASAGMGAPLAQRPSPLPVLLSRERCRSAPDRGESHAGLPDRRHRHHTHDLGSSRVGSGFIRARAPAPFAEAAITEPRGAERLGIAPGIHSRATGSPVEAISRGYFCAGSRKRRSSPLKSLLIIAAVLAGDPAATDPRLELLTRLFDSQADCERVKTESTGEGKGEIEGKKVLRIEEREQHVMGCRSARTRAGHSFRSESYAPCRPRWLRRSAPRRSL